MEEFIKQVVYEFYLRATRDILIGHQFRKIAANAGGDPLAPPMEAFAEHLPRIETFWRTQLLGEKSQVTFDLINKHHYLMIRRGELDRWVVLLNQTLDEQAPKYNKIEGLDRYILDWKNKISHFQKIFVRMLIHS